MTKRTHADQRAQYWLSEYNRYMENNNTKSANIAWRKAQHWLDRLNKLEGLGEEEQPDILAYMDYMRYEYIIYEGRA